MAGKTCVGICENCANAAGCVFLGSEKRPVYYCEEFRLELFESSAKPQYKTKSSAVEKKTDGQVASDLAQGLCCDCENRSFCVLRESSEGGVWRCEEYR